LTKKKEQGLTESIWWPDLGTGRGCFTVKFTEISPPVLPLFVNKNRPPRFGLSLFTEIDRPPTVLPLYVNRNRPPCFASLC